MPAQCPECGRFLRNDLVASLGDAPADCPRCGAELTAESFGVAGAGGDDPLAGWDEDVADPPARTGGGTVVALEPGRAVVLGIGGGIAGAVGWRRRPALGALLGAVLAVLAGAVAGRGHTRG